MSSPSETLTRQCSPFSVQEFGNLVALALDDRFSESLLQFSFDPDPASTSPPSSTPPSSPLSWLSNMTQSVRHSHWSPSTGRRRQFIDKLKRRASAAACALRPAVSPLVMTPTPQPITTTLSPYQTPAASISRHSSFFEDSDSDEEDPFTPYIPIASQRERGGTAAKLEQDLKLSHTPLSIFSRPSSSITRPTAASPPSSPRSVRSMSSASSASTATEHSSPATPTTPRLSPAQLNDVPSTPRSSDSHRWSLCTDDDSAHSHSYSYTYTQHPFAQQHLDDPFAKGSVQVVRRSQQRQEQHRSLPASPSPSSFSTRSKSTRSRTSPPRPPPSCPLPQPPCGADTDMSSEDSHAPSNTEWTLHLGVGASLSIKQKHSSAPVAPERRKPDWTLFLPLDVNYPGNAGRAPSPGPSLNSPSYASSVLSAATTATTASSMTSSSALSTPMLYSCFPSPPSSIPLPLPIGPSSPPHPRINVHTRRPALSAPSPFTPPPYLPLSSTTSFPTPPQLPSRSTTTALFETATGSTRLVHVRRPAITLSHAQSHFSLPHTGKGLEAVQGREPVAVYDYDYPTRPPRSSDSTCSTSSVASTATIGPGLAQRIAMLRAGVHVLERKMAGSCRGESREVEAVDVLVGREDNDEDEDDNGLDPDTEADSIYYSARSSFSL